jgi:hypothetical protein
MTFEKTYELNNKKQLIIRLPDSFKSKKRVKVTVEDADDDKASKIALLKKASKDPLFLSDIQEIQDDFKYADSEDL